MIRSFYFILEKEFKQMMRSKGLIRMLIMMPVIQLILLPQAANYSIKNISLAVVDNDHSEYSRKMIHKIVSSGYFKLTVNARNNDEAFDAVEKDKADLVLEIPQHFEKNLIRENSQKVLVQINAIEGVKAGLSGGYLANIISDFNQEIRTRWVQNQGYDEPAIISVSPTNWYNRYMNYYLFIVPGILVTLITGIGMLQTAFNMVKEKEIGTIEQINVTPVKKVSFILGKLVPYFTLSALVFIIGMLVSYLFYNIQSAGSYLTVFVSMAAFLFSLQGFGLLLSTYSENQQQAMSLGFFFMNILNMMSGLYTAIDSMPMWAKTLTGSFPLSHFIRVMRMVMLKGSSIYDVSDHLLIMIGLGVLFNTWAVLNYRKRS